MEGGEGLQVADAIPQIYPVAVAVAVVSGLTIVLDIPPLVWHSKRSNVAVVSLICWIIFLNFSNVINAIIWPNDDFAHNFRGYGLCDVEAKLFVGSYVGLSSALAAIMRNLANVLNTDNRPTILSAAQKRREQTIEIALCWVPPTILMCLHYIVQPSRYFIWGIAGCAPSLDTSWLSVVLIFIWTPVFALLDAYYAALVIYRVLEYRARFCAILEASGTSKHRFLRLLIMSEVLVVCFTPLQLYVFYTNVALPHHAFSWNDVHPPNWNQLIAEGHSHGQLLYDRWFRMACGVLVFLYFGISADAMNLYKSWFKFLCQHTGMKAIISTRSSKISNTESWKPLRGQESRSGHNVSSSFESTIGSPVTSLHTTVERPLSVVSIDQKWATATSRTIDSIILQDRTEQPLGNTF